MHKILYAAAAALGILGGKDIGDGIGHLARSEPQRRRRGYVPYFHHQSGESKRFYTDRAVAKRARKSAILNALADAGAIGRVLA
jgi:hypothetical protein